jgi:hypothetical protein
MDLRQDFYSLVSKLFPGSRASFIVVTPCCWEKSAVCLHFISVTLHAISAVAHTTHNHGRHGSQLFRCCLNRKMLDMPEPSSATSARANISKNNISRSHAEHGYACDIYTGEGELGSHHVSAAFPFPC